LDRERLPNIHLEPAELRALRLSGDAARQVETEEKKGKQTLAPSSLHVLHNVIKKDRPLAERELARDKIPLTPNLFLDC
jgi:hypothetical protein